MKGQLSRIQDWEGLVLKAKFDPATIAALCPTSLRQLERFFVARFRMTPRQWIREFRCRLAKELLAQGWSTKAVAAELYFPSVSSFCHGFKRVYRAPPQSFAPVYGVKPPRKSAKPP